MMTRCSARRDFGSIPTLVPQKEALKPKPYIKILVSILVP